MMTEMARWSFEVSRTTDADVRAFLAEHGASEGDLARFVEDAVNRELMWRTVDDVRSRNADLSPEEAERIVQEALDEVHDELWGPVRR